MNKNQFALTPPMGWNSYDYYDTTVTEADVKANADYMAAHLKQYGWEYIIVDIQWYAHDAGSQRDRYQYRSGTSKWTSTPVCCRIQNVSHLPPAAKGLVRSPAIFTILV